MELSNYLYVVKKRLKLIVLTTVIAVVVVVAGVSRSTALYQATTTLRVVPFGLNSPDYGGYVYFDRLANTYSNILQSQDVTDETKRILGLSTLPQFAIEIVPQTELMRLKVTDTDPERAQNVANTLAQLLISHNQSTYTSGGLQATIQERLDETQDQLGTLVEERDQLQNQITRDQTRLQEIDGQILAQGQIYDLLLSISNQSTGGVGGLQTILQAIPDETQQQIATLGEERDQLQNQITRDQTRLQEIDRQILAQQQIYDLLLANYNQAMISQLALASALSIIEPASLPQFPAGPGILQTGVVTGAVGLLGGTALAFLLERRRPRFHTHQQIETATQLSVVGKIPFIKKRYRKDLFATDPVTVEAFRRLRTNIFMDIHSKSLRTLVVVSALPKEGKSTIAANLALSIASVGRKVLLIDTDMYQSRLSRRKRHLNPDGLSDVIQLKKELTTVVAQSKLNPNLRLLPFGNQSVNSAEMLSSFDCKAFIEEALQTYDVVIFDTPPLLATTDALVIAPHVDGILWVIDRARTEQSEILEARNQLNNTNTNVVGIVVNRVAKDKSFYWYRRYAHLPAIKSTNGKSPKHEFEYSKN